MENISKELTEYYRGDEVQEFMNAPLGNPNLTEQKARSNGNASYKEKWRAFPGNKPKHETKCLVELHYQSDLGLQKFMWCVYWDGSEFRDYGGNNDIKEGAKVKWFIEEDNLHRPNK